MVWGGGQNLKQLNVERLIFRTSEISNIKRTKNELFDFIIVVLKKKSYLFELFEHSKFMMIYTREIGNLWNFDSFTNFEICYFPKL